MLDKQALHVVQQTRNLVSEELSIDAKTALTTQQNTNLVAEALNTPKQGAVLDATVCKLKAEFDVLMQQVTKTSTETGLLTQKIATEKAQITEAGVDPDSVVGRQKKLYEAQTNGFARDAEQKAAKLLVDTWNVRRTTDEGTQADDTNKLKDSYVGAAVSKLLSGVGA